MTLGNGSPTAEAPADNAELIEQLRRVREELRVVWQAIDELREVYEGSLRSHGKDDWRPTPRFIVSMPLDATDPQFAQKINRLNPAELPTDVPDQVRTAVAVRLRESQGQGGMDSLADTHRHNDSNGDTPQPGPGATQQRDLWDAVADAEPAENTPQKEAEPRVLVTVSGGVAEYAADRDVDVCLIDFDNEPDREIPEQYADLASGDRPEAVPAEAAQHEAEPAATSEAYTLDDWIAFRHAFSDGQVDAAGIRREFGRLQASKARFIEQLVKEKTADQLKLMAMQRGHYDARRNTKPQNAEGIYRSCLTAFTLGQSVCYQPMQETYEAAVERIVLAITDESIASEREKSRQAREATEKALTNPETFDELRQFVGRKGVDQLSDQQLSAWDRLNADCSRQARKQKDTVEQFQSAEIEGVEFRIIEGRHTREDVPLWIVQISSRVERTTFNELKIKARQLGGWWSSFKKDAAGFQFRSPESAQKFAGLAEGDADRSAELEARKIRKMDNAGDRINAVAASLEEKATETLADDEDKLKNTARRADMAASMRAQAYSDLATAKTLRSIAVGLVAGEATYLDGVWNAAQIRTLQTLLMQARRERINRRLKEEGQDRRTHGWSKRYDDLEAEPLTPADARHAAFPKPYLYKGHLTAAFAQLGNTPGVKQATAKLRKIVDSGPRDQDSVEFVNDHQVELLEDFLSRAKSAGSRVWWFDHCLDSYKRIKAANIHDGHELRTALRELVPHLAHAAGDDPVTKAEDELRGRELPGFFPTPRPVIEQMLELAGIEPTHRVLEPSCGKGDILDEIRREHPDVELAAIEQNLTLQGVLTAKGYGELVSYGNFLEHGGQYDRVLMNPPFEHGQDVEHVRHAYGLLAPGGRLVSIVCEGPFFRRDAKSMEFREWLEELAADVEQLPDDAFQGVEAFRQTGVKTRLVVINKL